MKNLTYFMMVLFIFLIIAQASAEYGYTNPDLPKLVAPEVTTTTAGGGSVNASNVTHNDLAGLQGGTSGEYYHTTSAQQAFLINQSYGTYNSTYALWAYNQSFDSTTFMKYNWTEKATTQTSLLQTSDVFLDYTQVQGLGCALGGGTLTCPAGSNTANYANVEGKRTIPKAFSSATPPNLNSCGNLYLNITGDYFLKTEYAGTCNNCPADSESNAIIITRWQSNGVGISALYTFCGITRPLTYGANYIEYGSSAYRWTNNWDGCAMSQIGGAAGIDLTANNVIKLKVREGGIQVGTNLGACVGTSNDALNVVGNATITKNLTVLGNGRFSENLSAQNFITSQFNLTDSNGKMVSGLFEANRRFLSIVKENSSLESFIYIVDRATQSSLTIFPNETLFPIAHFQKGNSPTECSVLFSQSGQEDVCMNNGTKVIDTGGTIRVGNLEVTSSIDTVYLTATSSINGDTVSATNGVSGSTGSFSTLTYSSSDPEAFGMLNITQSRFLTLIRASCTPQYAGAIWNYFNGSRMFYVKPSDCNLYKKVITVDGWEDYIDSGIDLRPIGDKAPCYNTNVQRTITNDQFTNETITKEVPILPYNKIKEIGVIQ